MKKTTKSFSALITGGLLLLAVGLNYSCNKDIKSAPPVAQNNSDFDMLATSPIAQWLFDSTWKESKQHLVGAAHNGVKYSSTAQAHTGKAAFLSRDSGYVSYNSAGTDLNNLTTGLTVDFWVYSTGKEGGAQCLFAIPQTGAFWPTHHVLLDGYNSAQGDTGLVKVMFKANKAIDYNERWNVVGAIPKFYHRWSHIQYSYKGSSSKFTLIINGKTYIDHVVQYTDGTNTTLLGNIVANPNPHGVVIGAFQNTWDPVLFGDRQSWMLPFAGRIDDLKIYKTALF